MSNEEYLILLNEQHYLGRLEAGLQYEEQRLCGLLQKNTHDIHANSKLPKVRADIVQIHSLLSVMTNLINTRLQKTYEFQFKSFKVESFEEITDTKQVQSSEAGVPGQGVPRQEGGKILDDAGLTQAGGLTLSKGGTD